LEENKKGTISEVAKVFFKLGCFAFGGPAAHIAMMEAEVVTKRKWMSKQHFLDLIGATNLIPGPNSTEMTMHCGHERAGWKGLFVAGICFIVPAIIITGVFGWVYAEYGGLDKIKPFFDGIQSVVLVIILGAVIKLGKKAVKGWELAVLGVLALAATLAGISEIYALLGAGFLGTIYFYSKHKIGGPTKALFPFLLTTTATTGAAATLTTAKVFWSFLKVGSILYGSGMVLVAYLKVELVEPGLLTAEQLNHAIAVGQMTPGPVLSTATFIGWQMTGLPGALAATAGMFLPSFLFVLILKPLVPKMRKSVILGYFLDCVNVGAVAVMVSALIYLGSVALLDMNATGIEMLNWRSIVILVLALAYQFGVKKKNPIHLIIAGAVLGYALSFI